MRVAVLGAGVAGLVAARRLALDGHGVDVYERWPGLGGQAATLDVGGGQRLERYYHHLFTSDRHIAALYEQLGMPDELEWRPSSVAVFARGRVHPFTTPLDLLRFGAISRRSRIRMGLAVLALQRRHPRVEPFEGMTARSWVEGAMGAEAWDGLWGPLLEGKFGNRADDVSMAWLWSKLTLRRRLGGEEARTELLGYPRNSWERLFRALADDVETRGGRVLIDRPAHRVARDDKGFLLTAGACGSFRRGHDPRRFEPADAPERYDAVLATVPNDVFEQLLAPDLAAALAPGYLDRLRSIEYHAALCLLLELDRPFTPYYWTNIADRGVPFVGLIEQTNLVEPERYDGRRFLYVANYLPAGHPLLQLDADELLAVYEPGLRAVNRDYSRRWLRNRWVFREPAAQPIVTPHYRRRMPSLFTGVPGLVLANTTQVYPEDRGTNYAVREGDRAAHAVSSAGTRPGAVLAAG